VACAGSLAWTARVHAHEGQSTTPAPAQSEHSPVTHVSHARRRSPHRRAAAGGRRRKTSAALCSAFGPGDGVCVLVPREKSAAGRVPRKWRGTSSPSWSGCSVTNCEPAYTHIPLVVSTHAHSAVGLRRAAATLCESEPLSRGEATGEYDGDRMTYSSADAVRDMVPMVAASRADAGETCTRGVLTTIRSQGEPRCARFSHIGRTTHTSHMKSCILRHVRCGCIFMCACRDLLRSTRVRCSAQRHSHRHTIVLPWESSKRERTARVSPPRTSE